MQTWKMKAILEAPCLEFRDLKRNFAPLDEEVEMYCKK